MAPTYLSDLHRLLAVVDPPDPIGRGHHQTVAGDPNRRKTVLLPLLTRWAVTRQIVNDPPMFIGKARKGFRVIDVAGVVHCVPSPGEKGCVLRWMPKDGSDPVQF